MPALIHSIACASIVAKVIRDRLMRRLALRYPGYGWERNQGYGTAEHRTALASLGVTTDGEGTVTTWDGKGQTLVTLNSTPAATARSRLGTARARRSWS